MAFLAAGLSGVLLFMGFPPFEIPSLTWVALVPLLCILPRLRPAMAALVSFWCGVVFFLGVFTWGLSVGSYTYLHHALLSIAFSLYLPAIGAAVSYIARKKGVLAAYLATPFVWVAAEYIKSNLPLIAYPWALLAHSQYQSLPLLQIASFAGTYGISFILVWVNAIVAAIVYHFIQRANNPYGLPFGADARRVSYGFVLGGVFSVMAALWFGWAQLAKPLTGDAVRIAAVQANIPQNEKWDPRNAGKIMRTYADMTAAAAADKPDLIVWPEAATPGAINQSVHLYTTVLKIAHASQTYLLIGSTSHQKYEGAKARDLRYQNSAYFIAPTASGRNLPRYDKIKLLAFAEYLPYADLVPWKLIQVPELGSYVPGEKYTVFEHPKFKFSATICWENIFPDLVRRFVKNGAEVIVNITNEAWFGRTAAPRQFLAMSVFRAVENQVYVVRCANTGISCIIDPRGRIVKRLTDEEGQELMIKGVLHGTVIPQKHKTFYTRTGDWLAIMCLMISGAWIVAAWRSRKR